MFQKDLNSQYFLTLKEKDWAGDEMNINTLNVRLISHTRGSGNLIWSTLTWSTRGTHMRLGSTMSEAMMSTMVPSDNELERDEMMKGESFTTATC